MKIKNKDIFARIRIGYRVVLTLVFAISCVVLLTICFRMIIGNKIQSDQEFENYYKVVENKLDGFQKTSAALFADKDIEKFCKSLGNEYDAYDMLMAGKQVNTFETLLVAGEHRIILTNLESDMCISGGGRASLKELSGELLLNEERIKAITNNHKDSKFYIYDADRGMINFVFRNRYSEDEKNYYCFITADVKFFMPHNDFVIAGYGDRYLNKTGKTDYTMIEKTYIRESVAVPGLTYKYIAKYVSIPLLVMFTICVLLCIAGMLCSKRLAEKILNATYKPIIEAIPHIEEYGASNAVGIWDGSAEKLIGESKLMKSALEEGRLYRKKNYLRNLLYDIEDYQEKYIAEYELERLNTGCRVVLMDFTNKGDYAATNGSVSVGEFAFELESRVTQSIPGELVSISDGRYVYVTGICDKDDLRNNLTCVLELAANFKMEAFVAVGDKIENLRELKRSFRNALDCMERKNAFPSHFIVFSSELGNENSSFYYPIDVEVQLIENIIVGNQEAVDEILSKILAKNLYEISLSAEKLRELKIVMVGTINRAINRMNKDVSDIFGENTSVYLEIGASRNKEEFAKSVRSVFGILCSCSGNISGEPKQDKIARDIVSYIEANFGDSDLSLEKLARIFFISQNHVSRVLKNKIGKSYKEYLNDVRINEAKRLLKNTPMTVVNVANNVGYTDIRAFNRLFKKYTNQTPNEYRVTE